MHHCGLQGGHCPLASQLDHSGFFDRGCHAAGAAAAWAAASAGGRHRDGAPLPDWMVSSSKMNRDERQFPSNQRPDY